MKLDILAFGAHPDDVELAASGTLIKHKASGKSTGVIDLTRGELGTRGSAEDRDKEAANAAKIMGLDARENLQFKDGFFDNNGDHKLEIIKMIRKYKPEIVLCNAQHDRHPDHGRGGDLVSDAVFLAGLRKIETKVNGEFQESWRTKSVYRYVQFNYIKPDFIVDISGYLDKKMEAILAYSTQFYNPASDEPQTMISSNQFLDFVKHRATEMGIIIGTQHGEGFTSYRHPGVKNLFDLI